MSLVALSLIPRQALPWLLGSQLFVLLMHYSHLPIWMWIMAFFVCGWRWATHVGWVSFPNQWIKAIAVGLACIAVFVAFDRALSLESASAFLIAAGLLKMLEMKVRRDAYIVIFVGLLILGVGFLYDQGIGSAALGVIAAWLFLTTLVMVHYSANSFANRRNSTARNVEALRLSGGVMLVSLPVMLALYLLFPRFSPLWSFTLQSSEAKTGLASEMSAGDIQELSQSDDLVFRASFIKGDLLNRHDLYWRAIVMDSYDGRTWRRSQSPSVQWYSDNKATVSDALTYEVIYEATGENWLYALAGVEAREFRTGVTGNDLLIYRRPVYQRIRYEAAAIPIESRVVEPLTQEELSRYTHLPADFNPRTRSWVQIQMLETHNAHELMARFMSYFKQESFFYTLKPSVLGRHEVDEFLFDQRRGFCAHYAGALVFLARSAGIPARMVTGYQGGEWNAAERYLTVRQFDAHAWVEVWFENQGWVRYDPTAMVAEDRILYGLERAVRSEGTFLENQPFSAHRLGTIGWLNTARLQLDSLNYYWQRWVLSYDRERQRSFMQSVLGLKEYQQMLYALAICIVIFFAIAAGWLWWITRPKAQSPLVKAWRLLQEKGVSHGVDIRIGETPANYCQRLAEHCPKQKALLLWLGNEVNRALYAPASAHTLAMRERALIRAIYKVRRQLPAGH